ncbi:MAG: UPF0058 family protein [Halobacteriaceae archaeon]
MKKQELIHLHGLLAEVGEYYNARENQPEAFEKYDEMGVRPTSIHKSKTDHKEAVFALAEGITAEIEAPHETEKVTAKAD